MTQHTQTPGPWKLRHERFNRTTVAGHNGALIASVHVVESTEHRDANARLIAAAPELLAALSAFVRTYQDWTRRPTQAGEEALAGCLAEAQTALNAAKGDKP